MNLGRLAFISSAFLSTLTFASEFPLWVNGKVPDPWTSTTHLSGVGSGASLEEADASAKRALSEAFKLQIRSEFKQSSLSRSEQDSNGRSEIADSAQARGELTIQSTLEIEGIELAEHYFDQASSTHYSLAVLKRSTAQAHLQSRLNQIRAEYESLTSPESQSLKRVALHEKISLLEKYQEITALLRVASPEVVTLPLDSPETLSRLRTDWQQKLKNNPVSLIFSKAASDWKNPLLACLSSQYVNVLPETSSVPPYWRIRTSLKETPLHIKVEGWIKREYFLEAEVSQSKRPLGTVTSSRIVTGRSPEACRDQIRDDLVHELCEKVVFLLE